MKNKQLPFWIFSFSVFTILLLPSLLKDGMFLDGLLNGAIARNLAIGVGSFWNLQYAKTLGNPFTDHPPLVFGIQSLFFKLLGDHLFVERLYCFLAAIISGLFIIKIWRHLFRNNAEFANSAWIPFLMWIITPVVFWSYTNNMLENTMTVFDLAAVYHIIKALETKKKVYLRLILAGALVLGAFLSKGPIGLFPLATIFIYWAVFKNTSFPKAVIHSLVVLISLVSFLLVIFLLNHKAFQTISIYLDQQIVKSIAGKREYVSSRYFIIGRLIGELVPMTILLLISYFIGFTRKIKAVTAIKEKNTFLLFFLIALSASLPIIVSLKQSGYYLAPSFPYFSIAAGILAVPGVNSWIQYFHATKKNYKISKSISIIFFLIVSFFSFLQIGKPGRSKEVVSDIHLIGGIVPRNSTVSFCPAIFDDWELHAYLIRYFEISLDNKDKHEFYISNKNCKNEIEKEFTKIHANTEVYDLYKRK